MRFLDKEITNGLPGEQASETEMEDFLERLRPEPRRKPSAEEIAAALESAQRLAAEADAENGVEELARKLASDSEGTQCVCGHRNREGTKFCGMCGAAIGANRSAGVEPQMSMRMHSSSPTQAFPHPPQGNESHHYHHHYHHHYFPGAEGMYPRMGADPSQALAREEKVRPNMALRGEMTRAEAAVRTVTQEWVVACNTKHLDDMVELYVADGIVLRSNCPPIRGAAAVREFFFGALNAGLGEVELEPLRVDVVGEMAYEAGRFKALVPSATGKRREERGKYLWVCQRQSNSEWKLTADCWSNDLTLSNLESDVPLGPGVKTNPVRKS